jgi:hypothetical protein
MMILCLHNSKSMEYMIGGIWRHLTLHTTYITWPPCIDKAFLVHGRRVSASGSELELLIWLVPDGA